MKSAPGGDHCPNTTVTLLIANQAIAAGADFTLGPVALNGALQANSQVKASPRGTPPQTAGGLTPHFEAYVPADNTVTVKVCNPWGAALVALAADLVIDVIAYPPSP